MKLYNSMTRKKEEFVPLEPGKVKMYSCGPTVYNYFHIGNARPFIIFDTLRRYFEYRGYDVKFVQNFTDIDDKVIKKANEEGVTYDVIADRYIKEYFVDAKGLGIHPATVHPRATETMDAIIDIVKTLIDNGHAYVAANGDVYFRTKSFPEYGKLSHQPLDELQAGSASRRKTRWTLPSGRQPSRVNRAGIRRGAARAVRAGISSAPQWSTSIWARPLTFTPAARI